MIDPANALRAIPDGLRDPLLVEYRSIVQNYLERRWSPAALSGGRFSEIVYAIIEGFGSGVYPATPKKPSNMLEACRKLETRTTVPRSFQILIPRLLPPLYEIRNNRNVGHVGGDVDPNHMDATAVLGIVNWIMSELVRVLHAMDVEEAQGLVDALAERRIPLVWQSTQMKRVLNPSLRLEDQILLLIASSPQAVSTDDLFLWADYENRQYFNKLLNALHKKRLIELSKAKDKVEILPPGTLQLEKILQRS